MSFEEGQQERGDRGDLQPRLREIARARVAVGAGDVAEQAGGLQAGEGVAGDDAVGGDGGEAAGAGAEVGPGGADQRAAGADHVVVEDDPLAGDLGVDGGDLGALAVVTALEHERRGDPEIVGE